MLVIMFDEFAVLSNVDRRRPKYKSIHYELVGLALTLFACCLINC